MNVTSMVRVRPFCTEMKTGAVRGPHGADLTVFTPEGCKCVGRTPEGEGGPNGPTGFLTLPGEEWSPPGIEPRNLNMIVRPNGTRNEHERSGGQQQEQKDLEKSC